jgi:hypothetical protein
MGPPSSQLAQWLIGDASTQLCSATLSRQAVLLKSVKQANILAMNPSHSAGFAES